MSKKTKMKKNNILNILIVICCSIFLFSSYQLYTYYKEYKKIDQTNDKINKIAVEDIKLTLDDEGKLKKIPKINMQELKQINSDVCGYIIIPDSKISFPLVYHEDMTKYLYQNIYLEYSSGGSIFLDASNHPDFNDDNTIIHGHHMKNRSMFADLDQYFKEDGYINTHRYIYLYTENELRTYEIFSYLLTDATSDVYTTTFYDLDLKRAFINEQIRRSYFEPENTPDIEAPIITLSTCSGITETSRYVIFASLISTKALS